MNLFQNLGSRPDLTFWGCRLFGLLTMIAAMPALIGCTGAVVGAGAAAGVAAFEERTIGTVADDTKIAAQIRLAIMDRGPDYALKIGIEVFEGRVLLTGLVPTENMRAEAVQKSWGISGVKDVLNEVQISSGSLIGTARDAWISAQLTTRIAMDEKIYSINYVIETVGGVVYLLGIAQNQMELNRVIAHSRNLKYVKKVINHVRLKGPT